MMELIPGLPDEIGVECLLRLPYTSHRAARCVCRRWRQLINGRDFFQLRKKAGNTHVVACLVQSSPPAPEVTAIKDVDMPAAPPAYRLTAFDSRTGKWELLPPIPAYPDGVPLFCQLVGVDRKLVVMGGWDPTSWAPVRHVFVYDFTRREWKRGRDMPKTRSFFAAGAVEGGRVVVAGGHDEGKNALRTASVYDVGEDEWEAAEDMSEERDECEGVAAMGGGGREFWVVSGYGTQNQGRFGESAEVYEAASGRWRRVDGAWEGGKCPRGMVRTTPGEGEKLECWSELEGMIVHVSVGMGGRALVAGSACGRARRTRFCLVDIGPDGGARKVVEMAVREAFRGFVQSGCCVEI